METLAEQGLTLWNKDVQNKIRVLYLEDKEIKQIQQILNVPEGTWTACYYNNSHGFRDFFLSVKKEKMLKQAEEFSQRLMKIDPENKAKILAIQQKEAEFLRETQGKDLGYTKRVEAYNLNQNASEPLDEKQRAKLDKLLGKKVTDIIDANGLVEPPIDGQECRVAEDILCDADKQ